MIETMVESKSDLELFAERLARGGKSKQPIQRSPTAHELAELKRTLNMRLKSGHMDLKLLALEWQYDVALLLDHMRHWMDALDRDFQRDA